MIIIAAGGWHPSGEGSGGVGDWCVIMHCDGDVHEFIPLLIEAGFDCIQPLEARAGNDVRKLKGQYGKDIAFFGNYRPWTGSCAA